MNFPLGGLALDPGNSSYLHWYQQVIGIEWGVLHMPGMLADNWASRMGVREYDIPIILVTGYLTTALLLAVALFAADRLRRWMRRGESGESADLC